MKQCSHGVLSLQHYSNTFIHRKQLAMSCNGKFSKAMWRSFCLIVGVAVATVTAAQERVNFPVGVGTKTLGTGLIWLGTKKGFFE